MSDHGRGETHRGFVAPAPAWRILRIAAETYADFMQFRIAATNRAERGGVAPEEFAGLIDGIGKQEAQLKRYLRDAYRAAVPPSVRQWQDANDGLGEHTLARLLGILGDPRRADPWHWEGAGKDDRHLVADPPYDRTVGQLWSYCGVGDPARRRRRGMDKDDALAAGSPRLRSLLFVIAEGCMKQPGSPYRRIYEARRAVTADRVHAGPCVRCGPSGKPAPEGSPWSKGHQLADALRIVAKEILRDLWLAAAEANGQAEPKGRAPRPASQSDGAATPTAEPKVNAPPVALEAAS